MSGRAARGGCGRCGSAAPAAQHALAVERGVEREALRRLGALRGGIVQVHRRRLRVDLGDAGGAGRRSAAGSRATLRRVAHFSWPFRVSSPLRGRTRTTTLTLSLRGRREGGTARGAACKRTSSCSRSPGTPSSAGEGAEDRHSEKFECGGPGDRAAARLTFSAADAIADIVGVCEGQQTLSGHFRCLRCTQKHHLPCR